MADPGPSFDDCLAVVDDPGAYEVWRADFDESAAFWGADDLAVPRDDALVERCHRYRFPDRAVELLVEHRPTWDDEAVRRLGAHEQWLVAERYRPATYLELGFPPPPPGCRLFYAYALLGLAARIEAGQVAAGIDPAVSAATFWDVGQQVMLHERIHGEADLRKGWWLCHHLGGHLFRLGPLQFHLSVATAAHAPALAAGDPFLDVHIPEGADLGAAALDASFAEATTFFDRHFPDARPACFGCASWLLDPVLADLAPAGSAIVEFQRRFTVTHVEDDWPSGVFEFVWDRPDLDGADDVPLDELAADTSLRKAIVDHLRGGGRIRPVTGVIAVER